MWSGRRGAGAVACPHDTHYCTHVRATQRAVWPGSRSAPRPVPQAAWTGSRPALPAPRWSAAPLPVPLRLHAECRMGLFCLCFLSSSFFFPCCPFCCVFSQMPAEKPQTGSCQEGSFGRSVSLPVGQPPKPRTLPHSRATGSTEGHCSSSFQGPRPLSGRTVISSL